MVLFPPCLLVWAPMALYWLFETLSSTLALEWCQRRRGVVAVPIGHTGPIYLASNQEAMQMNVQDGYLANVNGQMMCRILLREIGIYFPGREGFLISYGAISDFDVTERQNSKEFVLEIDDHADVSVLFLDLMTAERFQIELLAHLSPPQEETKTAVVTQAEQGVMKIQDNLPLEKIC